MSGCERTCLGRITGLLTPRLFVTELGQRYWCSQGWAAPMSELPAVVTAAMMKTGWAGAFHDSLDHVVGDRVQEPTISWSLWRLPAKSPILTACPSRRRQIEENVNRAETHEWGKVREWAYLPASSCSTKGMYGPLASLRRHDVCILVQSWWLLMTHGGQAGW